MSRLPGGNDGPGSKDNHPDEARVRPLPRSIDPPRRRQAAMNENEIRYLQKMRGLMREEIYEARLNDLLTRIKARLPQLEELRARDRGPLRRRRQGLPFLPPVVPNTPRDWKRSPKQCPPDGRRPCGCLSCVSKNNAVGLAQRARSGQRETENLLPYHLRAWGSV